MIKLLNIVLEIKTDGSMQNLINKISSKYYNKIKYIQSHRKEKTLFIVFNDEYELNNRINEIRKLDSVTEVNTTLTLFGRIIKQIFGNKRYR